MNKSYTKVYGKDVPKITGAGKGGGSVAKNTLFSTDFLILLVALGEGPFYRINPNGPQDVQIAEGAIDSLINLDGDGTANDEEFITSTSMGTVNQDTLEFFGDKIVTAQGFSSPVALKKGNLEGVPESKITTQETSASDWDTLEFNFSVPALLFNDDKGRTTTAQLDLRITIYPRTGALDAPIAQIDRNVKGKTDTPFKVTVPMQIPLAHRSVEGYRFSIEKLTDEEDNGKRDEIAVIGWNEIKHEEQAYPRTALIGYALKAVDQYTGGLPNFTSLAKALLVKVPSNYNQPVLTDGQIDWREIEVSHDVADPLSYRTRGYSLQDTGPDVKLFAEDIPIYRGTWDGTFVYSWTQNPVWILYDILTNKQHGLGIPEENIDKYRFYQIAQYCDACDPNTGYFKGVAGAADGSFRYKPREYYAAPRENQLGLFVGESIRERRFMSDLSIVDQQKSIDLLNSIASTFRAIIIYNGGKLSLAIDMPEEYPVMLFNDANIKTGSIQFSGTKESDIFTSIEVTYIEPSNSFKRETVGLNLAESNQGTNLTNIDNPISLDLVGVTRRSQALRAAQYQLASSKYLRRNITFQTSTDAMSLSPGDVISVATNSSGVSYGYGGKLYADSPVTSDSNVKVEHFTVPAITTNTITGNTHPLALRVLSMEKDTQDLYIVSNTVFSTESSEDVSGGIDRAELQVISKFNPVTKVFDNINTFTSSNAPKKGDLWSLGEIVNLGNYYSSKSSKLYKVTNLDKSLSENEITISAIEYISNVYVDSEEYIDYEPTPYVNITAPFSSPPTPYFEFTARPRTQLDGSIAVDGFVSTRAELNDYDQDFITNFYIAQPETYSTVIDSATGGVTVADATGITNSSTFELEGKNGFSSSVGAVRLLCEAVTSPSFGTLKLTIRGLSDCTDVNFNQHILAVNDGLTFSSLKGTDKVQLPVVEKSAIDINKNFVGYYARESAISREVTSYNTNDNSITIDNTITGSTALRARLPTAPFYITLNQVLAKGYYANNSFYVSGSQSTYVVEDTIAEGTETQTITIPFVAEDKNFINLYIDGVLITNYTLTKNANDSVISVDVQNTNTKYRIEVEHYTVPAIETGDLLEITHDKSVRVAETSFDPASTNYSSSLTNNKIYRIETETSPSIDLSGFTFINTGLNPLGSVTSINGNDVVLNYSTASYPGTFNLLDSRVYTLNISSPYEIIDISDNGIIPNLDAGRTIIKAQNVNRFGRTSKAVTKSVNIETLPIQKVQDIQLSESLYREQTGGVSVRVTCSFNHILNQQVSDYEISYKFDEIDDFVEDVTDGIASYNTVKLPATGVDENGKMYFTINNVNRGKSSGQSSITVRITPLNKNIRGITAVKSQTIVGKTDVPANIRNFTGGQQSDQITFFWQYEKEGDELKDVDTSEVIIRRAAGAYPASLDVFMAADSFVTVSVPSVRKSIPIDSYGTYTYLAMTKDTSGNLSGDTVATTLTTSRPRKSTVVAAYSEDSPGDDFTSITNTNAGESNFPSATDSTGGLSYLNSSAIDNANASATGWSVISGSPTDLLAESYAEYTTPIRDFGSVVTASISLDLEATQELSESFNDQKFVVHEGVLDAGSGGTTIVDTDGIGTMLGFGTPSLNGRYDANNQTWMTGSSSGNVWAVWNAGQFADDTSNANSYAYVVSVTNANTLKLGRTFFANGEPTGGNTLSNLTSVGTSYELVNLAQFNDLGTKTFQGSLGVINAQTFIRTSTDTSVHYANSNVNNSTFGSVDNGFVPYEAGTRVFRHAQIKHVITNSSPQQYDYILDKFRYTVDKEQTIFTDTKTYTNSPTVVDYSEANFIGRPAITYTILDKTDAETNTAVVVTTAASETQASFKIFAADGTGEYPTDSTAIVMITAVGV